MKTPGRRKTNESGPDSPLAASSPNADDYVAPSDVLFRDPILPYETDTTVLGISIRFRTNSQRVLGMFRDAFGEVARNDDTPEILRVQVVVYDGSFDAADARTVHHICPDPVRVLVHGPGGMAIADPLRREALIYANDGLVRAEAHFRHNFLEAATLALVTHFDRQPIHAAAIVRDGHAVLLMGSSGAGKSTLAYLAGTSGLTVLSEDIVWIQLTPSVRVWGRPRSIHLLVDAETHFPELRREVVSRQPNGKHKMTVELGQLHDAQPAVADTVTVCLLQPGGTHARIARVESDELRQALMRDADAGFDRYPERRVECARMLAENGGWRLTLSRDPHDSLSLIQELLEPAGD